MIGAFRMPLFTMCSLLAHALVRLIPLAVLAAGAGASANATAEDDYYPGRTDTALNVRHIVNAEIRIDGKLNEAAWQDLAVHGEFYGVSPDTLIPGDLETRVRLFHTDAGLYLSADMDQDPNTLVERLSTRDQGSLNRDYVSFTLDTSGDAKYGFWFQLNLGDSISDGTLLPEFQYSRRWDGAWYGASARTATGWTAEFFIPWSILSMPEATDERVMGLYVSRNVAHRNERWGWPGLPFTKPKFMSMFQQLSLEGVNPKQQWAAYPYASSTFDALTSNTDTKAGIDLFWRPSSSLQLNATLNPDFGNVEADDVIVNLTAFETFFPEKRLFFQEGQEVFITTQRAESFFSSQTLTLLHTRRIGGRPITPDIPDGVIVDSVDLRQPTELLGAAKFSGQNGKLRYGILAAFEDDTDFTGIDDTTGARSRISQSGRDFGIFRALYEDNPGGSYSALGMITTAAMHETGDAQVHGIDAHYFTPSGKWKTEAQVLSSHVDGQEEGKGGFLDVTWIPVRGFSHQLSLDWFDEHLDINDLGFLRRNDSYSARYRLRWRKSDYEKIRDTSLSLFAGAGWNQRDENNMAGFSVRQRITLNSLNVLSLRFGYSPERFEDRNSFGNGSYKIEGRFDGDLGFETDDSKRVWFAFDADWLEEDLGGDRFRYRVKSVYRPNDRITMDANLRLTERTDWLLYQGAGNFTTFEAEQWSATLKFDLFLTAKQQFRAAVQWVGIKATEKEFFLLPTRPGNLIKGLSPDNVPDDFTISQANIQLRYRWEIAPLSDLFVVYTRGGSLPNRAGFSPSFGDLFNDAVDEPLGEQLVVKLRYRLDN